MRNNPLQFQQVAAASHHLRLPSCHLPLPQVHHACSCYRHQVSQVIKSIMNKIAADNQHGWLLHSGQGEISPPRRAFGPLPVMWGKKDDSDETATTAAPTLISCSSSRSALPSLLLSPSLLLLPKVTSFLFLKTSEKEAASAWVENV